MMNKEHFDIAVIGAGFGGSLTALGLHRIGYRVILIEKEVHPRFAIGESSTPIADLILRDLADRYDFPWLRDISRYGRWQQTYPEISCGLKRGFSYYKHEPGQHFRADEHHTNELLVAASPNDERSDTNWYRSDVDAFFVDQVKKQGIAYWDETRTAGLQRLGERWEIEAYREEEQYQIRCRWLIDATGSADILNMLGVRLRSENFRTHSRAIFSHFTNVMPWQEWLHENGIPSHDYPYDPDHSALHHLLDEGWLWLLQFNNGITSAGLVLNRHNKVATSDWEKIISRYPSLSALFEEAVLAESPGKLIPTKRLQRRAEKVTGPGWVALPHTAGFVDPLHSTGIAHSLSGIERILYAFESGQSNSDIIAGRLRQYERSVFNELDFVDLLLDGCYRAMDHFELFHIYSTLYFTAAIHYEQKRIRGDFEMGDQFLSAGYRDLKEITEKAYRQLRKLGTNNFKTEKDIPHYRETVKKAIAPYNIADLLAPDIPHMYAHTDADF